MVNKQHLLRQIQELEFTALDLNLYLDTHPDCHEALCDYNKVACQLDKSKSYYEAHFGPLSNFGESTSQYPFCWVTEPFPWEKQ